ALVLVRLVAGRGGVRAVGDEHVRGEHDVVLDDDLGERHDLQRGRGGHAVADADLRVEALLKVPALRVAHPPARVAYVRLELRAGPELHAAADVDALGAHDAPGRLHDEALPEAGEAREALAVPPAPRSAAEGGQTRDDGRSDGALHPHVLGRGGDLRRRPLSLQGSARRPAAGGPVSRPAAGSAVRPGALAARLLAKQEEAPRWERGAPRTT